ncbi:hypothetical protein ACJVDH_19275 [Pedobacter sp. AW1-32]|uniref:hypothetical protein n=1 Tax=Pedobacter sp. AW1-32 TaxID=3383026 RepID=UPI003FEF4C0D
MDMKKADKPDLSLLTNKKVKAAISALQNNDEAAWFALFNEDVLFYDDGNQMQFKNFFKKALGHERFLSIDKVELSGMEVHGDFHSDQWGKFRTFFRFELDRNGKFSRLDIGQSDQ